MMQEPRLTGLLRSDGAVASVCLRALRLSLKVWYFIGNNLSLSLRFTSRSLMVVQISFAEFLGSKLYESSNNAKTGLFNVKCHIIKDSDLTHLIRRIEVNHCGRRGKTTAFYQPPHELLQEGTEEMLSFQIGQGWDGKWASFRWLFQLCIYRCCAGVELNNKLKRRHAAYFKTYFTVIRYQQWDAP